MDANHSPPQSLELDPELLGHDPELASTVESLKRPRSNNADQTGTQKDESAPSSDRAPVSPRNVEPSPPSKDRPAIGVPSGFVIRALPVYGALGRRLPIPLLGAALIAVVSASAVAWGMMYLLKPAAFARTPASEPRVAIHRALERDRMAPVLSSVTHEARPTPTDTAKTTVAPRSTVISTAPVKAPARHEATPGASRPATKAAIPVVAAEPDTSAKVLKEPLPASVPPERKAWFE